MSIRFQFPGKEPNTPAMLVLSEDTAHELLGMCVHHYGGDHGVTSAVRNNLQKGTIIPLAIERGFRPGELAVSTQDGRNWNFERNCLNVTKTSVFIQDHEGTAEYYPQSFSIKKPDGGWVQRKPEDEIRPLDLILSDTGINLAKTTKIIPVGLGYHSSVIAWGIAGSLTGPRCIIPADQLIDLKLAKRLGDIQLEVS